MIKTEFKTLISKENANGFSNVADINPLRCSENSLNGNTEQITSEIKLPGTRIQSTPETGSQSCEGDISTEWNIDEQDDLLASVLCNLWQTVSDENYIEKKELTLGNTRSTFSIFKDYYQGTRTWQHFKGVQINQAQINFELNSFVKMVWSLLGANQPKKSTTCPYDEENVTSPLSTASFKTLQGSIRIGEVGQTLVANRQISNISLTINNNMEKTSALFETESIEMALGDFQVTGSFDYYNSGSLANELYNDTIDGKTKELEITVYRDIKEGDDTFEYGYKINLIVHLDTVSESKDGNKLKNSVNFTMNDANGIKITKYKMSTI